MGSEMCIRDRLQIVPGITSDRDPCTLFYLGQHKPKAADPEGEYVEGEWVPKE